MAGAVNAHDEADAPVGSQDPRVKTRVWHPDGTFRPGVWALAEEVPVEIRLNGASFAVMMATPRDLEDFVTGFALTEGLLDDVAAIEAIQIENASDGIVADLQAPASSLAAGADRTRGLSGRSGCGVCGVTALGDAVRAALPVPARPPVAPEAIAAAFRQLSEHQPMNRINRSVHAAALATPDGTIVDAREDVGRHNALDKLIGSRARAGDLPLDGFVVLSSRTSFEMVLKAATAGAPLIASISAPTTLALTCARNAGIKLAAAGPDGTVVLVD
ncbi:formate dehydrogenase accessory sulfurtransferase FdhD [Amorphus orientalis]|uniref:Sulfur carrier protein FdhD n=1 Tax=Amorphus orientalis TaxID=649198 RepID=A0AAE4AT80_9HYPH|nr:formate dehydrogenase accessory sulfurtransferase FdhD [Amorphus orientalis]MDQ0316003.1 FdhD protein [Amorphus orientalis]